LRRAIALVASTALLAAAVALLPPGASELTEDTGLYALYFNDPTTAFSLASGATTKTRSACGGVTAPACVPGVVNTVNFGNAGGSGVVGTGNFRAISPAIVTLWLSSNVNGLPLYGITVQLFHNGIAETLVAGGAPNSAAPGPILDGAGQRIALGPTPQKVVFTAALSTNTRAINNWNPELRLAVHTAGSPGQPVDVTLHYGSSQFASGVTYKIDRTVQNPVGAGWFYLGFTANGLTESSPTGTDTTTRAIAGHPAQPTEVTWGQTTLTKSYTLATDILFNITLQSAASPPANAEILLTVNLYHNQQKLNGTVQLSNVLVRAQHCATAACPTFTISAAIPAKDRVFAAGDTVEVKFILRSAHDYIAHFGSKANHVGFTARSGTGGGPAPTTSATTATTSASQTTNTTATSATTTSATTTSNASTTTTTATNTTVTTTAGAGGDGGARAKDVAAPAGVLPSVALVAALVSLAGVAIALRRRQ
jgi:hypothetical protein